jgi:adenine deaminase
MGKPERVSIARGLVKAPLVLRNANVVNVLSGTIDHVDVAVSDGVVCGLGSYRGIEEIDLGGKYLCPGFIDAHVHIESSMLTPQQFARTVLPWGTTTVVADPHEIGNIRGVAGVRYMIECAATVPLDVFVMIPSCVPTTAFETAGATIGPDDVAALLRDSAVLGLGEVMDYPSVLAGGARVLAKIAAVGDRPVDGHSPGVTGLDLCAYVGTGIRTDHECRTPAELSERVRLGQYVFLREGSHTRNLRALLPGVNPGNWRRIAFCTDDKHPEDIRREGHVSRNVNLAIAAGIPPIEAIRMATLNAAECYGLADRGAVAPGRRADFIVFADLAEIVPELVFKDGAAVARGGCPLFTAPAVRNGCVENTVRIDPEAVDLDLRLARGRVKVIGLEPGNATTRRLVRDVRVEDGKFVHDPAADILKLAVVERHRGTGNVGLGLVEGYGLHHGAVAMTIAHDSHNLIVVGDNDADMRLAIAKTVAIGGGIVLVKDGACADFLPLEIGGIMTVADAETVIGRLDQMRSTIRTMGVDPSVEDPFLALAFLSLPVIPELKLTDRGLFDVSRFALVPVEED